MSSIELGEIGKKTIIKNSALAYWKHKLQKKPEEFLLAHKSISEYINYQPHIHSTFLTEEITQGITLLSQQYNTSFFVVLLAAFQLLLSRYSGQTDIVIASPIRCKDSKQNCYLNDVAVFYTQLNLQQSFQSLLQQVKNNVDEACLHLKTPFTQQLKKLKLSQSVEQSLFQILLIVEEQTLSLQPTEIRTRDLASEEMIAGNTLTLKVQRKNSADLELFFSFDPNLYHQTFIERMAKNFKTLLVSIVENSRELNSHLTLLEKQEYETVISDWNEKENPYPIDKTLHGLFEEQVAKNPKAIALQYNEQQISYEELNQRANQLRDYLISSGVGKGDIIAVCLPRSFEFIISLIGIMKTNAAYLVLDPTAPNERLQQILDSSQSLALISSSNLLDKFAGTIKNIINIQQLPLEAFKITEKRALYTDSVASVYYTSGSTGEPKGVLMLHRAIINRQFWIWEKFPFQPEEVGCQRAGVSFVTSLSEIFSTLLQGIKLVLVPDELLKNAHSLAEYLKQHQVSRIFLVPSLLQAYLQSDINQTALPKLKLWITAGEAITHETVKQFIHAFPEATLMNLFGLTEAGSLIYQLHPANTEQSDFTSVPIGKPISNTKAYILDNFQQPVPIGVPGELYIGGVSVAGGYLNQPELTAERFLPNPFNEQKSLIKEANIHLYKTGDRAVFLANGDIQYLGRADYQVKIRGYRVELGEIESMLRRQTAVPIRDCAVVAYEERLVAYLTQASNKSLPEGKKLSLIIHTLRQQLEHKLPDYMIPSLFLFLKALPLNSNGKLNRKALPVPDKNHRDASNPYVAPRNQIEQQLTEIWAKLLDQFQIGIADNFFQIGGHSLLVFQLFSRIRSIYKVEISLQAFFDKPTIANLAHLIEITDSTQLSAIPPLVASTRPAAIPLSFAQQRLWVLEQLLPNKSVYNITMAWQLTGVFNQQALQQALDKLIERHESLRTGFSEEQGKFQQIIREATTCPLSCHALVDPKELAQAIQTEAERSFDLKKERLIRACLWQVTDKIYVFQLTLHHIISDGWSSGIIKQELAALYNGYLQGSAASLPELPVQYADFTLWQRNLLTTSEFLNPQLAYWEKQLENAPSRLELPFSKARPAERNYQGTTYQWDLPQILVQQLKNVGAQCQTTLFMTLLGAFYVLLYRYSNQDDIVIGSPIANRHHKELEGLIGFFVNTLALRLACQGSVSFADFLAEVRKTTLDAYQNQDIPFDQLVDKLKVKRNLNEQPLFQVMFVFQAAEPAPLTFSELESKEYAIPCRTAKFDLTFNIIEGTQGLSICIEYATELFDEPMIERMAEHFTQLLASIVASPQASLDEFCLLTEKETRQVLVDWNQTADHYSESKTIHQLFEEHALHDPKNIAVSDGITTLTYEELNKRANQYAHYLRSMAVKSEVLVAISLERSIDCLIAILGILKAGGAYLPIDPDYPTERVQFMLNDAHVSILITHSQLVSRFGAIDTPLCCIDKLADQLVKQPTDNLKNVCDAAHLAYVIYTSGSTGKPKGVMIEHQGLYNLVAVKNEFSQISKQDRILQFASMSFDASVWEWSMAFSHGASLYLVKAKDQLIGQDLIKTCQRYQITVALLPPTVLSTISPEDMPSLKLLALGGEATPRATLDKWSKRCTVINAYGPTEGTIYVSLFRYDANYPANTIGRPLGNIQLYVLNKCLQPVAVGVTGELYISGIGVARGYLNRPDLTSERFIANPFSAVSRLYKTGDLVRYLPDGNIEYMGRADHQVKIRGFRIECGEIENILRSQVCVQDAFVIVDESRATLKCLVAYIVIHKTLSERDPKKITDTLKIALSEQLPNYMVPSVFMIIDKLPLTPNGKINREALPKPDFKEQQENYRPPLNEIEKKLTLLWQSLLQLEQIGVEDNFFDLGGNSILLASLYQQLPDEFKQHLALVDLFRYTTIRLLASYLEEVTGFLLKEAEAHSPNTQVQTTVNNPYNEEIAVIGMALRVPGAMTPEKFWENLQQGVEAIKFYADSELAEIGIDATLINNPAYIKARGTIDHMKDFDAEFFNINSREAEILDPQHRIFLETAWMTLEDAGYDPKTYLGRIGVFAGNGPNRYLINNLLPNADVINDHGYYSLTLANEKDMLATRAAYKLGLTGAAMNIQTACSTSLVAIHQACRALQAKDCDMVLAGGISLGEHEGGYLYQQGMILSPDGHCRAFDEKAQGTVPGQGIGLVLLKRLSDAIKDHDSIYAVIKGSAINNDANFKIGYTAPSVEKQIEVIQMAYKNANVNPATVTYIEAHGTGTTLGDPIELKGLEQAFKTDKTQYCALGSVKSNIGHLDTASGVIGLIKAVLCLKNKKIPPSLHFEKPNPNFNFETSPFFVNTKLMDWSSATDCTRRAGVSSFGIGGTNAHVVLEEYTPSSVMSALSAEPPLYLLTLSARSETALAAVAKQLGHYLLNHPEVSMAEVAYTLQLRRRHFSCRQIIECKNLQEATEKLLHSSSQQTLQAIAPAQSKPPLVFAFSGQGKQMTVAERRYCQEQPSYQQAVEECLLILQYNFPQLEFKFNKEEANLETAHLENIYLSQIELFSLEYAFAKLLMAWGLQPDVVVGHSLGEYTAACIAGVLSLEHALLLIVTRALLMKDLPEGGMLSVILPLQMVNDYLQKHPEIDLAAINSENQCVVAGEKEALLKLKQELEQAHVVCRILSVNHAYHSRYAQTIIADFSKTLAACTFHSPHIKFLSTVEGTWINDALTAEHWIKHVLDTVQFTSAIKVLLSETAYAQAVFVEVGPGKVLTNLIKQHSLFKGPAKALATLVDAVTATPMTVFFSTLGQLWLAGFNLKWKNAFFAQENLYSVPLPTYPFDRKQYWVKAPSTKLISPVKILADEQETTFSLAKVEKITPSASALFQPTDDRTIERSLADVWQRFFKGAVANEDDTFDHLGVDSLMAVSLAEYINKQFDLELTSSVLINTNTIRKLTHYIKEAVASKKANSIEDEIIYKDTIAFELIELQKGKKDHLPLILVHAIGGTINVYGDLVKALGKDYPVYAFQALSAFGKAKPYTSIKDKAMDYAAELQKRFPETRYVLGGLSYGGIVAYEIAQHLTTLQEQWIPSVLMIDSPAPGSAHLPIKMEDDAELLQYLFGDRMNISEEDIRLHSNLPMQVDFLYQKAQDNEYAGLPDKNLIYSIIETWKSHQQAMFSHELQPYSGRVLYFRATESLKRLPNTLHLPWIELVEGGIEIHRVSGNHHTMIQAPFVGKIIEPLKHTLKLHSKKTFLEKMN
jgi:amino acid adenylation domain-containing protein